MGAEAGVRFYAILIDHTKRTVAIVATVLIPEVTLVLSTLPKTSQHVRCKIERVERLQPTMISMTALIARTRNNVERGESHGCL